jgi:signal transduction histidine kinase
MLMQPDFQPVVNSQASSLVIDAKRALNRIGGPTALTWPVAAISLFWAMYISVGFDRVRFGTSPTGWLFVALVAHAVTILAAIPFRLTILPATPRRSKPVQTLFVFAFLGLVRSTTVGELAVNLNLAPSRELGARQIAGVITVTAGLAFTTILVSALKERKSSLVELLTERNRLLELQRQSESLFEEKRLEVHRIIDESIKPSLEEINQTLKKEDSTNFIVAEKTTELITSLIDKQLRPISDSLHERAIFSDLGKNTDQVRTPIVRLRTTVSVKNLISPLSIYFSMAAVTTSGSIYFAGLTAIVIGAVVYLPFLALVLIGKFLIPEDWKLNVWLALPITVIAHLGAGFPSLLLIRALDGPYPGVGRQFVIGVFGFVFSALFIAVSRAVESELESFKSEFRAANAEAALVLGNLNQRIWLNRKNMAQLLHGSVQAALTAANLRLKQEAVTSETLLKVKEDISRAISTLSTAKFSDLDIENSFEELIDLWDGVCDIDIQILPTLLNQIKKDVTAASCLNEFLKECVNNAIKHGDATEVNIQIRLITPAAIEIEVINNGRSSVENKVGVGTRILDEVTTSWTRTRLATGTQVLGVVALSGAITEELIPVNSERSH